MAIQSLNNGESGATIRGKINSNFLTLDNEVFGGDVKKSLRAMIRARLPVSWDLMGGAPTITLGAANASSAIVGAVNIPHNSSRISESTRCITGAIYPDSILRIPRNFDGQATGAAAAFTSAVVSSWSIATEAQEVEFMIKGLGISSRGRVWVTEHGVRKYAGSIPVVPGDGNLYWVKMAFSATSMREIEVEMSGGSFGGFNVSAGAAYGKRELRGPHILVAGDSFAEGPGSIGFCEGWAPRLLRLIGADRKTISALGSTGYGANASGGRKSLLERVQNDIVGLAPDVVIHANGINDTGPQVAANAPQVFDAIEAALPNCLQIVFGPFQPRSIDVEAQRSALAAACEVRNIVFIDNVTMDEITGSGHMGAKVGDGNSDIVIGDGVGDVTHPSLYYGHGYLAEWRFAALCKAIGV